MEVWVSFGNSTGQSAGQIRPSAGRAEHNARRDFTDGERLAEIFCRAGQTPKRRR